MDLTSCLMATGLTNYEAKIYITLLSQGVLNGYEAAKLSGISRSNVYNALEGLVEKGAAYKIDGESIRYSPLEPQEYCRNKERAFGKILSYIKENAPTSAGAPDAYITISGDLRIIDKMKNMVENARERLYISMSAKECELIEDELASAIKRGLKVVIITSNGFSVKGAEIYYTNKQPFQIRLIADSAFVLTGNLHDKSNPATCLFTQNKTLITLFKEALRNEIDLINLKKEGKE